MEGSHIQNWEKSRPPHPRTASRSSTSTSHSRVMSQSANSSSSLVTSSPKLSNAHTAHRYHHTSCAKPTSSPRPLSRPTPQLSREGSVELGVGNPVSSFLQERLQTQRQVEAQRSSASRSPVDMGTATQRSPSKTAGSDVNRPQSTSSPERTTSKGPGLKEMEKVISGLHKQNFDLKLELYHRRERQSVLEGKLETLETENTQVLDENQKLLEGMEKRDKAIEEAVAMIVTLEARLEQMTQEREMVHRIDTEGIFAHHTQNTALEVPSPRRKSLDVNKLEEDARALARMPSFLSDQTEATENLRRVYLGARGSIISLTQAMDDTSGTNKETHAGLISPSLSVLSESSFASVYGKKSGADAASFRVDEPLSLDGPACEDARAKRTGNQDRRIGHTQNSGLPARSASLLQNHDQRRFQPIANVVHDSLLQKMEKSGPLPHRRHTLRPSDSSRNLDAESSKKLGSPSRIKTRDERRGELRKVMTDTPGGVSLIDHGMPPTPDTISSATLRRMKNSNDTLLQRQDAVDQQSQSSSFDLASAVDIPTNGARLRPSGARPAEREHHKEVSSELSYQQAASISRPRSADETTLSNRRERRWSTDSKESDDSLESSIDIWLRQAGSRAKGRESPDLFKFPDTDRGSWAMDAMFGPRSAYAPTSGVQGNTDHLRDLMSAQQALFGPTQPPHPPERQSSTHAPTGSTVTAEPAKGRMMPRRRGQHMRRNSADAQIRAQMKAPAPALELFSSDLSKQSANIDQRRTQYPPIVGHQGARNGLKRLWRRSLGAAPASSPPVESPTAQSSPTVTAAADDVEQNQQGETVTWISRSGAVEDDRTGATPPPILRNPRQRYESAPEDEAAAPSTPRLVQAEPATPKTTVAPKRRLSSPVQPYYQPEAAPAAGQATGARRKWLTALGRSNGGKQRAA